MADWYVVCVKSLEKLVLNVFLVVDHDSELKSRCSPGRFCSRGAQRVLRYGDREYVMLHLIFIYLMPGEGQPAAYAASDL